MKNETMTSRKRVKNAIEHQPIDRMPIDLGVHFSTGISAYAYHNLRKYLGLSADKIEMIDCVQGLARVDDDIIERFHIDTILLNPTWEKPHIWNPRGEFNFSVPATFQPVLRADGGYDVSLHDKSMYMPNGGFFFDGAWPDFYDKDKDGKLEYFAKRAEYIYKETDKFTLMMGFPAFFGDLDFACDMLTDPDICLEQNEEILKEGISYFDKMNKMFGQYIGAIEVNSDLGTQGAPMCSPESYEEVCYPYLKRFCEHVHQNSDIKVFMHSCGSINELIPYIISAGIDILNPIQISADNMDPADLKQKYGSQLCFWGGGCETQTTLWSKTPNQIAEHTKELISILKPNSGFVFNQVHNIMGNVPAENIVAMLDTAYTNSFYE